VAEIGDHALIGDTRTAALVSSAGAIDWMCVPRFDGDPMFGCLVGGDDAGVFSMQVADPSARLEHRQYVTGSVVVESTWSTASGTVQTRDGFVSRVTGALLPPTLLVREVHADHRPIAVDVRFDPRLGPERARPRVRRVAEALACTWGPLAAALTCTYPGARAGEPWRVMVEPGHPLVLVLAVADREPLVFVDPARAVDLLSGTDQEWQRWSTSLPDLGPFHDLAVRSLLTLRVLTYAPSGAPVAAPTTSLPEQLGGDRNWDYRYAWPRDASLGIGAFLDAGSDHEAEAFMYWLLHAGRLARPRLPVVLDIDGRRTAAERTLDGWPGYRDSRPVRLGNDAAEQHQLDVYGWVLDAGHRLEAAGHHLFDETWRVLAGHADFVAEHWSEPDSGIWEVRGDPRQWVHSKVMGWTALDRAIALTESHRVRARRLRHWHGVRDEIRRSVLEAGFDADRGTFVRAYDDPGLDAALSLVGVLGFDDPSGPRVDGTLAAIRSELHAGGPLLYRYRPGDDTLSGSEGAFLPCSFWFAHALVAGGRVNEANEMLSALSDLGGPLGLFPEEIDPSSGDALGNFPQALSHSSFVRAAVALRDARTDQGVSKRPSAVP
jgi:GH15 family glucan-1,4-alpha-glucosidase